MTQEATSTCQVCGASVYQEHLDSGIARHEDGKLMCKHCVEEYEESHDSAGGGDDAVQDFEPIQLDTGDDEPAVSLSSSRIHSVSSSTLGQTGGWDDTRFARALQPDVDGATRCRIFHAKLSEGAISFLNNQINEWLERNAQIRIKFATTAVGMLEGKHSEPNIFLTVFY